MFYFQSKFWAEKLILLKDTQVTTSWYCIDVNVHDKHILLINEKCHLQELLPFVRVGQYGDCTFRGLLDEACDGQTQALVSLHQLYLKHVTWLNAISHLSKKVLMEERSIK